MRIIDIYREDVSSGTGFRLVAENLIQTGENSVSHSRNAKVYTMADGSIVMYTAEKDKIQTTLSLECTEEQADMLCDAKHYGKLLFAGVHSGTKRTATPTDWNYPESEKRAFACYLTGSSRTKQIAGDLYSMEIPMEIDFTENPIIPVAKTKFETEDGFRLGDQIQKFSDFIYEKDGIFHRKQTIITSEGHLPVLFPVDFPEFSEYLQWTVYRNGELCWWLGDLVHQRVGEVDLSVPSGLTQFELILQHNERICKPLRIGFRTYQYP